MTVSQTHASHGSAKLSRTCFHVPSSGEDRRGVRTRDSRVETLLFPGDDGPMIRNIPKGTASTVALTRRACVPCRGHVAHFPRRCPWPAEPTVAEGQKAEGLGARGRVLEDMV